MMSLQSECPIPTNLESLPIELLCKIGQELAPHGTPYAWHDGATTAATAASCSIASRATQHVGIAAYRALLAQHNAHDASVIPDNVTQKSTVKQLRAALAEWRMVRTGNKADLWTRIMQAYSPSCPVPRNLRHRNGNLRSRAPIDEYIMCGDHCAMQSITDMHAASLKRFGSLLGWMSAYNEHIKEKTFFTIHCQPYYDEEVCQYVDEWDEGEDDYYKSDYWRERERYRNGYVDEDDELESVTKSAMQAVKPKVLQRWISALDGGLRCAIANPHLPDSFRRELCAKLAGEELDGWIGKNALTMLDDILHLSGGQKKKEIVAFSRKHFFTDIISNLDELDAACDPCRFEALYQEISVWSSQALVAHKNMSVLCDMPTLTELYPSISKLLDIDARLAKDSDAFRKDFEELEGKKEIQERQKQEKQKLADKLLKDIRANIGNSSVRITCAMCPASHRTFDRNGLRSHASGKHGVIVWGISVARV